MTSIKSYQKQLDKIAAREDRKKGCDGTWSSLPLPMSGIDLQYVLTSMRDDAVDRALKRTGGNREKASKLLGMHRTSLVENLRARGLITSSPERTQKFRTKKYLKEMRARKAQDDNE